MSSAVPFDFRVIVCFFMQRDAKREKDATKGQRGEEGWGRKMKLR